MLPDISGPDKVRAALWFVVSAGLWATGFREFLVWGASGEVVTLVLGASLAVTVGLSILKSWRVARWLSALCGLVALLYAGALIFFGSEDVGGPAVSFPSGFALGLFGVWNVMAAAWG